MSQRTARALFGILVGFFIGIYFDGWQILAALAIYAVGMAVAYWGVALEEQR